MSVPQTFLGPISKVCDPPASPEALVSEVIDAFRERFDVTVETVKMADEKVAFNVPRELRATTNA